MLLWTLGLSVRQAALLQIDLLQLLHALLQRLLGRGVVAGIGMHACCSAVAALLQLLRGCCRSHWHGWLANGQVAMRMHAYTSHNTPAHIHYRVLSLSHTHTAVLSLAFPCMLVLGSRPVPRVGRTVSAERRGAREE